MCVVDGVLLAIGGEDQSEKTSSIYGLDPDEKKWRHVGDLPFACSRVDTLLLSGGGLLMVDGDTQQVLKITLQGKYICTEIELIGLLSGIAKLFPITPIGKEADKSLKEADERYWEYLGTVIVGGDLVKWVGCNTPTRDMTACCLNVCNCAQTYWFNC